MSRLPHPARIQLWLDRLNRQAASQLTVAEFCAREGVSLPSFYQWKRRLSPRVESASVRHKSRQPQPSPGNPAVAKQPRFTELVLSASPATASVALPCVSLPGGITISLGTQPEMACLIIDRLLQHAATLHCNKAAAC
jgi:hypothetical protein